jgi:hypothetical protein
VMLIQRNRIYRKAIEAEGYRSHILKNKGLGAPTAVDHRCGSSHTVAIINIFQKGDLNASK